MFLFKIINVFILGFYLLIVTINVIGISMCALPNLMPPRQWI